MAGMSGWTRWAAAVPAAWRRCVLLWAYPLARAHAPRGGAPGSADRKP